MSDEDKGQSEINSLNDEMIKIDIKNKSYEKKIQIILVVIFLGVVLSSNQFVNTDLEDYYFGVCFLSPFILYFISFFFIYIPIDRRNLRYLEYSPNYVDNEIAKIQQKILLLEYKIDIPDANITFEEYKSEKWENEKMEALYDFCEHGNTEYFSIINSFGLKSGYSGQGHNDKKNKVGHMEDGVWLEFMENPKYMRLKNCFFSEKEELFPLILGDDGHYWQKIYSRYIPGYAEKLSDIQEIAARYFPTCYKNNNLSDYEEGREYDVILCKLNNGMVSSLYKAGKRPDERSTFTMGVYDRLKFDWEDFSSRNKSSRENVSITISNPMGKTYEQIEDEMILAIEWEKENKEKPASDGISSLRAADDLMKGNNSGSLLTNLLDAATVSYCTHCGSKMEGGPGGIRRWYCSSCGQYFNEYGDAVG